MMLFDLLLASGGTMTTFQVHTGLNISKPISLKTMRELEILGLVSGYFQEVDPGRSMGDNDNPKTITIYTDWEWFLSDEFKELREGYESSGQSKYKSKKQIGEHENTVKKISPLSRRYGRFFRIVSDLITTYTNKGQNGIKCLFRLRKQSSHRSRTY